MGRYSRHGDEVRGRLAELVDRGFGRRSIARELGLPVSTAEKLVGQYRRQGIEGLVPMATKKFYAPELKLEAVLAYLGGATREQVMARFEIRHLSQLEDWVRRYREHGAAGLQPGKRGRKPRAAPAEETLEQKVRRLEMENAALKKLQALAAEERRRKSR
jgi:transposase